MPRQPFSMPATSVAGPPAWPSSSARSTPPKTPTPAKSNPSPTSTTPTPPPSSRCEPGSWPGSPNSKTSAPRSPPSSPNSPPPMKAPETRACSTPCPTLTTRSAVPRPGCSSSSSSPSTSRPSTTTNSARSPSASPSPTAPPPPSRRRHHEPGRRPPQRRYGIRSARVFGFSTTPMCGFRYRIMETEPAGSRGRRRGISRPVSGRRGGTASLPGPRAGSG